MLGGYFMRTVYVGSTNPVEKLLSQEQIDEINQWVIDYLVADSREAKIERQHLQSSVATLSRLYTRLKSVFVKHESHARFVLDLHLNDCLTQKEIDAYVDLVVLEEMSLDCCCFFSKKGSFLSGAEIKAICVEVKSLIQALKVSVRRVEGMIENLSTRSPEMLQAKRFSLSASGSQLFFTAESMAKGMRTNKHLIQLSTTMMIEVTEQPKEYKQIVIL